MVRVLTSAVFALSVLATGPALAGKGPFAMPGMDTPFNIAADNCYSLGQQVAAEKGATLASAEQVTKNGQPACRIVIVVPGNNGQHPRRQEIVVGL